MEWTQPQKKEYPTRDRPERLDTMESNLNDWEKLIAEEQVFLFKTVSEEPCEYELNLIRKSQNEIREIQKSFRKLQNRFSRYRKRIKEERIF